MAWRGIAQETELLTFSVRYYDKIRCGSRTRVNVEKLIDHREAKKKYYLLMTYIFCLFQPLFRLSLSLTR